MNIISVIMAAFALIGAFDRIFGNRIGLGKEFEKGFHLFGTMALSMIGMIVISPVLAEALSPCFDWFYGMFHIDPSIIPASLFANDMGGASLASEIAKDDSVGMFNALVVSSMMGATVSFTIPLALTTVKYEKHKDLLLGLLCGIVTIPVGCFISGLMCKISVGVLLLNLLPLIIFAAFIAAGLLLIPQKCVKIFNILGVAIKIVITVGLTLGILKFLTGVVVIKGLDDIKEGALICFNATVVMSGAFPLLFVLSKLLSKPLKKMGTLLNINDRSALGFVSTLATNVTTFEMMNEMDCKGTVLNAAFAVSAAFTLAGHLAFTLAFNADYLPAVMVGKLISGLLAVVFAAIIYKRSDKTVNR